MESKINGLQKLSEIRSNANGDLVITKEIQDALVEELRLKKQEGGELITVINRTEESFKIDIGKIILSKI